MVADSDFNRDIISRPFLTEIDSRAAVRGSRDPLGLQPIWTRFGRRVVGNLTTVSNSVRDFTVLILGYHFAERVSELQGRASELDTFLKWEQLAAYARGHVNHDWSFRGTERVKRILSENPKKLVLSADRVNQILSDQKTYGLWGLYTVPARASGLLYSDQLRLTNEATSLVEEVYLPILTREGFKNGDEIVGRLSKNNVFIEMGNSGEKLLKSVGRILKQKLLDSEIEIYRNHLLHGGVNDTTDGRQKMMAELLKGTNTSDSFVWCPDSVFRLATKARSRGKGWETLAECLDNIRTCESLLAPVSSLFGFLLSQDGRKRDNVVRLLRDEWGNGAKTVEVSSLSRLQPDFGVVDSDDGKRWMLISQAMSQGRYKELIDLLILQNKTIMLRRDGSPPWLEIRDGKFFARFRDEQGSLVPKRDLPRIWRFSYFLDSLRAVTLALQA